MTTTASTSQPSRGAEGGGAPVWTRGVWPIILLAAGLGVARLVYLLWFSPYSLIEDEAHYWEWSRRLDWSYYTKGPGIALAIRAATGVLGTSEFAIRVPAVIASSLATVFVGVLAASAAGTVRRGAGGGGGLVGDGGPDWRVGLFAAGCFQLAPVNQLVGFISTIDGPYVACWAAACLGAWWALERRSSWAWVMLGAAIGVGFLFKYTILLLPPGILLYALLRRWGEGEMALARCWRRWMVAGSVLALLGLAPVVVWNAEHGWPTVRHLLGHLGLAAGDMPVADGGAWAWSPVWTLEFIGMQLGVVGPALILALVAAVWGVWRWWEASQRIQRSGASTRAQPGDDELGRLAGRLFLVCCAAPVLGFYLLVTFFAEAEGNWAMAAYVTLLPLAGWFAAEGMREYRAKLAAWRRFAREERPWSGYVRRKPETVGQMLWHATLAYGLVAGVVMLRVDLAQRGLAAVDAALAGSGVETRLAEGVPVGRFLGGAEMGLHAAELVAELRDRVGKEPFVVAQHYGRASMLAFYMPGRPVVYCTGERTGGRRTQYDFWPQTCLDDPALIGRPAVMVGDARAEWSRAFGEIAEVGPLRGDPKRGTRPAYLGAGFRGLPGQERGEVAAAGRSGAGGGGGGGAVGAPGVEGGGP